MQWRVVAVVFVAVTALVASACALPDDVEEPVNGTLGIDLRIYTTPQTWAYWEEFTQDVGSPALKAGDTIGGDRVQKVEGELPDVAHPDATRIISTRFWVVTVGITSMTVYATSDLTKYISDQASVAAGVAGWATAIGVVVTKTQFAVAGGVLALAQQKSIDHANQAIKQRSPDGCVKWKFGGDALLSTTLDKTPTFMGKAGNEALNNPYCDGGRHG